MVSEDLREELRDWTVHTSYSASDHRFITFSLRASPTYTAPTRFSSKFLDNSKFRREIQDRAHHLPALLRNAHSPEIIQQLILDLTTTIQRIYGRRLKVKKQRRLSPPNWWTPALRTTRSRIKALMRIYNATKDPKIRTEYGRSKAQYKRDILAAKNKSWKCFCASENKMLGRAFEILKDKGQKARSYNTILEGMPLTSSNEDIQRELIFHHFSTGTAHSIEPANRPAPFPKITAKEAATAVFGVNPSKAPGLDKLDPRIIRHVHEALPTLFSVIFNTCLKTGYFPETWKEASVIFFHKLGKSPTSPAAYRPICLLQSMSKVFEKAILFRLNHRLEKDRLLHNNQFGFREGRNTSQCNY